MASQPTGSGWNALILIAWMCVVSIAWLIIAVCLVRPGWRFSLRGLLIAIAVIAPPLWLIVYVAKGVISGAIK